VVAVGGAVHSWWLVGWTVRGRIYRSTYKTIKPERFPTEAGILPLNSLLRRVLWRAQETSQEWAACESGACESGGK
jgi:hypothetical protein